MTPVPIGGQGVPITGHNQFSGDGAGGIFKTPYAKDYFHSGSLCQIGQRAQRELQIWREVGLMGGDIFEKI